MPPKKNADKDAGHSFEDYFKRAASPMLVLHLLNEKPMYVYQMARELDKRSNGVYTLSLLYPVIYRLVKQGFIAEGEKQISDDNRVRQYYSITPEGRDYLAKVSVEFKCLVNAVNQILKSDSTGEYKHDNHDN